jgi:hypothetical protein
MNMYAAPLFAQPFSVANIKPFLLYPRWVLFIAQFYYLRSLTPGGRIWFLFKCRRHREFSLPVNCGVSYGSTTTGYGQADLSLPTIAVGMDIHLLVFDGAPKPFVQDVVVAALPS